ncbi:MAG: hypothetical protein JNK15_16815 [Planctomycetes bacterium]|nr:hypothetical protein [Planctomycetota bacterium]
MTEIITRQQNATTRRFVIVLPVLFAVGSVFGWMFPGHGAQLFAIGGLPGVWACFLVAGTDPGGWLLPTLVGGLPILWFLGQLLDRLRIDPWVWIATWALGAAVAGYVLLQQFADLDAAIEFHGSLLAYLACAANLGCYAATLLTLALGAGRSAAL